MSSPSTTRHMDSTTSSRSPTMRFIMILWLISRHNGTPLYVLSNLCSYRCVPTIEEFQAILMIKPSPMLSLKPHTNSISFKSVLQHEFGLTKTLSEAIFLGHVMDLQWWIDAILRDRVIPRDNWTIPMCITMILVHYRLVPSERRPSVKIFYVAYTLQ